MLIASEIKTYVVNHIRNLQKLDNEEYLINYIEICMQNLTSEEYKEMLQELKLH